jgi:estrogen-related receptor beta like 1
MDDKGASMTDTSPLVKIKQALTNLKNEVKELELRIGVVGHSLMQAKNHQYKGHNQKVQVTADGTTFEIEEDEDAEISLSM